MADNSSLLSSDGGSLPGSGVVFQVVVPDGDAARYAGGQGLVKHWEGSQSCGGDWALY